MSESVPTPKGSVFLSYASQDAGAAKRIGEALRSHGIEVWFDQDELRGGDAWDQRIRSQIKECALFIPVISATTQDRAEGYFRLEWHLAEQRSLLIAKGRPFILPVTIDGTSDRGALVPEAFLAVQWTRLPGGETPEAFCARVRALLSGPTAPPAGALAGTPAHRSQRFAWKWTAAALVAAACLALALWRPWAGAGNRSPGRAADTPASQAQELVARAWDELDKTELGVVELEIADGFCKRATDLDAANADAWAAWAQVNSWYVYHNYDTSTQHQEKARLCAA